MKSRQEFYCCCTALLLWSLGAVLLWEMWRYQESLSDPLGAYIQFTVMFLATFYVLALFPIKHCLDRFLFRSGPPTESHGQP